MPITIEVHPEGCLLSVRAQPGAKRDALVGEYDGRLKVAVTAPAQDGRANAALTEVIRKVLGLRRSQIELLDGATAREKRFLIRDFTPTDLTTLIQSRLDEH